MKKKMLYISINDGSDTRINKEVKSLYDNGFSIYFIGIGETEEKTFVKEYCTFFEITRGSHNSKLALLKYYFLFLKTFFARRYDFIHIINEQNYLLFLPFLYFHKQVVIDIFDSMFLKGEQTSLNQFLQRIVYKRVEKLLVTDENRQSLMPQNFAHKYVVLPNYPYKYKLNYDLPAPSLEEKISIFYYGSLTKGRGSNILKNLLEKFEGKIQVIMAGWVNDKDTEILLEKDNVTHLGTLDQKAALVQAESTDYLLCFYEPINDNNINASPNKIWDAIQVKTPLLINGEVKISSFIQQHNIGIVLPSFYDIDYNAFYQELKIRRNTFNFSEDFAKKYTWEGVENRLLEIYQNT